MAKLASQVSQPNRLCPTRALKNARFPQTQAPRILPPDKPMPDFGRAIPPWTLGQIHRAIDPASLVTDLQIKAILKNVTFPRVTDTLTDPAFSGRLFFVQIQFTIKNQGNKLVS